jgi:hypothetical protein
MDRNSFDLIMQEVLKQKQLLEHLEKENWQLRRQLADLCEARGIFVEIGSKRFALLEAPARISPTTDPVGVSVAHHMPAIPQTPQAEPKRFAEEEGKGTGSSITLEETMVNTDAALSTRPVTLQLSPVEKQQPTDENEQAALRRELIGSFLLADE